MKKFLIIIFSLILLLCSCEKKEYHLIELTGDELVNHLSKDKSSLTLAIYSENYKNSAQFLNDLQLVSKRAKENIYYIDIDHIDMMNFLILPDLLNVETNSLKYVVYQDSKKIIEEEYTSYDKMFATLNGKKYEDVELVSLDEKKAILDEAKKLYDEGYISNAYDMCQKAWPLDEAKVFFNESNLFKIVNQWEYKNLVDNSKKMNYIGIVFLSLNNAAYMTDTTVKVEEYIKPSLTDYDIYYYRIKDNVLCMSEKNDGKCKYEYEILDVSDSILTLKKNNKEYKFSVAEEVV